MEKTKNYGLVKPSENDYYNVENFNKNADTLDDLLKLKDNELTDISNRTEVLESKEYNPNLLINGNFDIWQRGESFSGPSSNGISKICDMFAVAQEGGAIINTNRIKDNNPKNSHILLDFITAGGTSNFRYYFEPEIYKTFSNKTFTIAIDCEASEDVPIMVGTFNGLVAGSWSDSRYSTITTERKTIVVTATFNNLSQNTDIGMLQLVRLVNGKNSKGNDFKGQIKIYRVKMEEGDRFTGFKSTRISEELEKCKYYFERLQWDSMQEFAPAHIYYDATVTDGTFVQSIFKVSNKRINPTVTIVNPTSLVFRPSINAPRPISGVHGYKSNKNGNITLNVLIAAQSALSIGAFGFLRANDSKLYIDINAEI